MTNIWEGKNGVLIEHNALKTNYWIFLYSHYLFNGAQIKAGVITEFGKFLVCEVS